MNRRKAFAKMTNVVHAGWMTKSPPERQLRTFRLFRSNWKKRYFVLRKPSGSLPDQYELHYYKDQRCNNKKGSIDLEQCEQIIEALDSDIFPYLLAIKTCYKHKMRTYYLATDTENEMNAWVQWLCHVCGLRPEDQPTDIPDPKPGNTTSGPADDPCITNGVLHSPQQPAKKPTASPLPSLPRQKPGQPARAQPLTSGGSDTSYISPESITAGQLRQAVRKNSIESNSDQDAPPLPQKRQAQHSNGISSDDDVFIPSLYDHPPPQRSMEAIKLSCPYNVPPVILARGNRLSVDDTGKNSSADVRSGHGHSPRTGLRTHADSSAPDGSTGRAVSSRDPYDYPHRRPDSPTYSDGEPPPERPPKSCNLSSPYQNLPPTGKIIQDADYLNTVLAPAKVSQSLYKTGYDIPRSSLPRPQTGLSQILVPPVKPTPHSTTSQSAHTYLNTMNIPGQLELPLGPKQGSDDDQSSDNMDPGSTPPAIPPPRTGFFGESKAEHSNNSIYQCPPPSPGSRARSGSPARSQIRAAVHGPNVSPRIPNGNPTSSQVQVSTTEEGTTGIFSTKRTRSFKSPYSLKNTVKKHSPKTNTMTLSSTVPAPRPVLPPRPKEMSTSEDDEEQRGHDQEEETHHPLSLLRSVPAPSPDAERELKYIDLAMPESCQEPPRFPHSHGHGHAHGHSPAHSHADRGKESATEYREIDFVKTQALNDAKRVKDKERKNDDQT